MNKALQAIVLVTVLSAATGATAAAAGAPETAAATTADSGWITVGSDTGGPGASYDGVVEAVRQTTVSVQVSGAITELAVKAGDTVKAGQLLMRIDARAATQGSAASDAQVLATQASADVARKDLERQQRLYAKGYVSQAALERSEAQLRASEAQLAAQQSAAAAAHTQAGYFVVRAPWSGVIAELPVARGDLAMPGKPLATLYDPTALRVTVAVPEDALPGLQLPAGIEIEIPRAGPAGARLRPAAAQRMPLVDAATHSAELRLDLPTQHPGITPGMFARAWLPASRSAGAPRIRIPDSAVLRRSELTAVYVRDGSGRALLRQVRVGESSGGRTEILAGIATGDRILADAAAARPPRMTQP